jgi:peptide deformylase
MIRTIVTTRDPKLRQATKPVTKIDKKVLQVMRDLEETLKVQKDPEGVGIAATQIGIPLKMFLIHHKGKHLIVCNPKILKLSKKTNDPKEPVGPDGENHYIMEGCLSLPHFYGPVKRAWEVEFEYDEPMEIDGHWKLEHKKEKFTGFFAQIIQHEVDHLNGKVFVDRLLEQKRALYQLKSEEWHEVDLV